MGVLAAINENLEPAYWWLTAISLPLWLRAIWWNVAAAHGGVAELVKLKAATAVLAIIYFVANCVLLFTNIFPGDWSNVMRGFQLLAIPIVWELPGKKSVRLADRIRKTDARLVEKDL